MEGAVQLLIETFVKRLSQWRNNQEAQGVRRRKIAWESRIKILEQRTDISFNVVAAYPGESSFLSTPFLMCRGFRLSVAQSELRALVFKNNRC